MINNIKKQVTDLIRKENGMVLPSVLIMFAIGGLMVVPSVSYIATSLNAGTMAKTEFQGILVADAGIEDALWKIENETPATFPYSYELTNINACSVDVTIDEIDTLAGEEITATGHHAEWFVIDELVTYDAGIYSYSLSATNNGSGNIKIVKILIDLPSGVEYVPSSTSSNITQPANTDPVVSGSSSTGITLIWENSIPRPVIATGDTEYHYFELNGPPGIPDMEGHGFIEAQRDDIGTVWNSDSIPYTITAQAKDASNNVIATIRAGVWTGSGLDITCWQVYPKTY